MLWLSCVTFLQKSRGVSVRINLKKIIITLLAGTSIGYGGSLLYRRSRDRRKRLREQNACMDQILRASLLKLAEVTGGKISVSEIYYFIWILERVSNRHRIEFPEFGFKVDKGLLFSSRLTGLLRQMLKDSRHLRLEGDKLIPSPGDAEEYLDCLNPGLAAVIEETTRQWMHDFPEEPLVRFGRLFR
jgi:hypothetical protein